jgi:hypothetical protein
VVTADATAAKAGLESVQCVPEAKPSGAADKPEDYIEALQAVIEPHLDLAEREPECSGASGNGPASRVHLCELPVEKAETVQSPAHRSRVANPTAAPGSIVDDPADVSPFRGDRQEPGATGRMSVARTSVSSAAL